MGLARVQGRGAPSTPSKYRSEQICYDALLTRYWLQQPSRSRTCRSTLPRALPEGRDPMGPSLRPTAFSRRPLSLAPDRVGIPWTHRCSRPQLRPATRLVAAAAGGPSGPMRRYAASAPLAADPERLECCSCVDCARHSSGNESQGSSPTQRCLPLRSGRLTALVHSLHDHLSCSVAPRALPAWRRRPRGAQMPTQPDA